MSAYARASARRSSQSVSKRAESAKKSRGCSNSASSSQKYKGDRGGGGGGGGNRRRDNDFEDEDEFGGLGLSQIPLSQASDVLYPTLSQVLGGASSGSNNESGGEGRYTPVGGGGLGGKRSVLASVGVRSISGWGNQQRPKTVTASTSSVPRTLFGSGAEGRLSQRGTMSMPSSNYLYGGGRSSQLSQMIYGSIGGVSSFSVAARDQQQQQQLLHSQQFLPAPQGLQQNSSSHGYHHPQGHLQNQNQPADQHLHSQQPSVLQPRYPPAVAETSVSSVAGIYPHSSAPVPYQAQSPPPRDRYQDLCQPLQNLSQVSVPLANRKQQPPRTIFSSPSTVTTGGGTASLGHHAAMTTTSVAAAVTTAIDKTKFIHSLDTLLTEQRKTSDVILGLVTKQDEIIGKVEEIVSRRTTNLLDKMESVEAIANKILDKLDYLSTLPAHPLDTELTKTLEEMQETINDLNNNLNNNLSNNLINNHSTSSSSTFSNSHHPGPLARLTPSLPNHSGLAHEAIPETQVQDNDFAALLGSTSGDDQGARVDAGVRGNIEGRVAKKRLKNGRKRKGTATAGDTDKENKQNKTNKHDDDVWTFSQQDCNTPAKGGKVTQRSKKRRMGVF